MLQEQVELLETELERREDEADESLRRRSARVQAVCDRIGEAVAAWTVAMVAAHKAGMDLTKIIEDQLGELEEL